VRLCAEGFAGTSQKVWCKDAENFYVKGNKAAGTRLRNAYLEIKNLASEGRNEVQSLKMKANN
jgi:hypothetical protein